MKKKVKLCKNHQCKDPVNKPQAIVCAGCGCDIARITCEFLSEEEIQERLNPKPKPEAVEEVKEDVTDGEKEIKEYIICPACHKKMVYTVGLEFCDGEGCGEYVGDQLPIPETEENGPVTECGVTAMCSLDGRCLIELKGDFMKIGREAEGKDYFTKNGKRKVSREHAIVQKIEDKWHLSYCKREDRNYSGGVENPIYINNRRLESMEKYCLMAGDEIAFSELDKSDSMAAFFRIQ